MLNANTAVTKLFIPLQYTTADCSLSLPLVYTWPCELIYIVKVCLVQTWPNNCFHLKTNFILIVYIVL